MQTTRLRISVKKQELVLKRGRRTLRRYPVSTSAFGLGTEEGSLKTPTGRFRVAEKIGAGAPGGTVFKSRRPVGKLGEMPEDEDMVVSRILWLEGLERENANTHGRFIYIHGTNQEKAIGRPASHGCVRMRNEDVVELFDLVPEGTPVRIAL